MEAKIADRLVRLQREIDELRREVKFGLSIDALLFDVVRLTDGVTAPSSFPFGWTATAQIYVDSADGDLKIRFSDGTVKTIITD
jgi:hypothetical protein